MTPRADRTRRSPLGPMLVALTTACWFAMDAPLATARGGQGDDGEEIDSYDDDDGGYAGGRRRGTGGADAMSAEDDWVMNGVVELVDSNGSVDYYDSGSTTTYTEILNLDISNGSDAEIFDVEFVVHLNNEGVDDEGWDPTEPDRYDYEMWVESVGSTRRVPPGGEIHHEVNRGIRTDWNTFDIWMVGWRWAPEDAMEALKYFHYGHDAQEAAMRTFGLSPKLSAGERTEIFDTLRDEHDAEIYDTLRAWLKLPLGRVTNTSLLKHTFAATVLAHIGGDEDLAAVAEAAARMRAADADSRMTELVELANEEAWSTMLPVPAARVWVAGSTDNEHPLRYYEVIARALDAAGTTGAVGLGLGAARSEDGHTLLDSLGFAGSWAYAASLDDEAVEKLLKRLEDEEPGASGEMILLSLAEHDEHGKAARKVLTRGKGSDHYETLAAIRASKRGDWVRDGLATLADEGDLEDLTDERPEVLIEIGAIALRTAAAIGPADKKAGDDAKKVAKYLLLAGKAHFAVGSSLIGERVLRSADALDPDSGALEMLRDVLLEQVEEMISKAKRSSGDMKLRALDLAEIALMRADRELESDEAQELMADIILARADELDDDEAEALLEKWIDELDDASALEDRLEEIHARQRYAAIGGILLLSSPLILLMLGLVIRTIRFGSFASKSGGKARVKSYKQGLLRRFASSDYGLFSQKLMSGSTLRWEEIGYVYKRGATDGPGRHRQYLDVIASTRRISVPMDMEGAEELSAAIHERAPEAVARSQRSSTRSGGGSGRPPSAPVGMPVPGGSASPGTRGPAAPSGMPMPGASASPSTRGPAAPSGMPMPGGSSGPIASGPGVPSGMPMPGKPLTATGMASPSVSADVGQPLDALLGDAPPAPDPFLSAGPTEDDDTNVDPRLARTSLGVASISVEDAEDS